MDSKKHGWTAFAIVSVLAVFLAVPTAGRAEEPAKHVMCEIANDGKTEKKQVASAEECTQMGGKVVTARRPKPHGQHQRYKK